MSRASPLSRPPPRPLLPARAARSLRSGPGASSPAPRRGSGPPASFARIFSSSFAPLSQAFGRCKGEGEINAYLEPGFRSYIQAGTWDGAALAELAAEFARLFLLPGGVSPYGASWLQGDEGAVPAHLEGEIASLYDELAIRPHDFGLGNVPSDHIGMLLSLTAVALSVDVEGDLAARCDALLDPWAGSFGANVLAATDAPLYRAAAALLLESVGLGPDDQARRALRNELRHRPTA